MRKDGAGSHEMPVLLWLLCWAERCVQDTVILVFYLSIYICIYLYGLCTKLYI